MQNYLFSVTSFTLHERDMWSGQASLILGQNNLPQFTSLWNLHQLDHGWKKAIYKNLTIYTKGNHISSYGSEFKQTKYPVFKWLGFSLQNTHLLQLFFFSPGD